MLMALGLGFAIAFVGSMPIAGPISILVFRCGLRGEFRRAMLIACGGALGESAYALLAFLGFSSFLVKLPYLTPISRAVAAVILLIVGIALVRTKDAVTPEDDASERPGVAGLMADFSLGLSIALLNPTLIATWTAVITTLYSIQLLSFSNAEALPFALGSALGMVTWFFMLLTLVRRGRAHLSRRNVTRMLRGLGVFVLGVAAWFAQRFVASL